MPKISKVFPLHRPHNAPPCQVKVKDARQARNEAISEVYQEAVKMWEAERELAISMDKRPKPKTTKPKRGPLEPPIPRPKRTVEGPEDKDKDKDDGE